MGLRDVGYLSTKPGLTYHRFVTHGPYEVSIGPLIVLWPPAPPHTRTNLQRAPCSGTPRQNQHRPGCQAAPGSWQQTAAKIRDRAWQVLFCIQIRDTSTWWQHGEDSPCLLMDSKALPQCGFVTHQVMGMPATDASRTLSPEPNQNHIYSCYPRPTFDEPLLHAKPANECSSTCIWLPAGGRQAPPAHESGGSCPPS